MSSRTSGGAGGASGESDAGVGGVADVVESPAAALPPLPLQRLVRGWLEDDTPAFDAGGLVVGDVHRRAHLLVKSEAVLAGVPFADAVFRELGLDVEWRVREGELLRPAAASRTALVAAVVSGPARRILLAERTALNILTRASGIATQARRAVNVARAAGWHGSVAGTRKTTPGFRQVEKYALLVGGAATHRMDLSAMTMLKDNHVWSAGSITRAVTHARTVAGFSSKIEVECRSLDEAREACAAGADIVMLDNFAPTALHAAAAVVKKGWPGVVVEASGGITADTLPRFFGPCVDVVSMGALTQGYPAADLSLKIDKAGGAQQARDAAGGSVAAAKARL